MRFCKHSLTIIIETTEDVIAAAEAGLLTDDDVEMALLRLQLTKKENDNIERDKDQQR